MRGYGAQWPGFGLDAHKGYGTAAHMAAIARLGPCPQHRLTFAPLRYMFPAAAEAARGAPLPAGKGKAAAAPPPPPRAGPAAAAPAPPAPPPPPPPRRRQQQKA